MNANPALARVTGSRLRLPAALLLTAVIVSLLAQLGNLESRVYDLFQRYQYQEGSDSILLVTVDAADELEREVWSAAGFAALLGKLEGAGVVAATQPLRLPEVPGAEQISALAELERQAARSGDRGSELQRLTGQLAGFRAAYDEQQMLAERIRAAGNVVLSVHASKFATDRKLPPACADHQVNQAGADGDARAAAASANAVLAPPAAMCAASRGLGFDIAGSERSNATRATRLLIDANGVLLPSLPLAAMAALAGNNRDILVASAEGLTVAGSVFRTGPGFEILARQYSNANAAPVFATVAATDLLAGNVDRALVTGRIVLVGEGVAASDARQGTPLLLAATGLSNLLENDYVLRPQWLVWLEYSMLAAILLLVLLWLPGMPGIGAALVGLVLATIMLSIEAWFLVSEHIWVQFGTVASFAACAVWIASFVRTLPATTAVSATVAGGSTPRLLAAAADELDLQFSVLRQQAMTDDIKEQMYRIALAHNDAEEFAKAERVLQYIYHHDPGYKHVAALLEKLSGRKTYRPLQPQTAAQPTTEVESISKKRRLGRYTIERKLGEGAMATVYLGTDPKIGRQVAIKTVALAEEFDAAKLADARQQFLREAESAGRLNHPNIIAIYDVGEDRDVSYLAMEYFDGVALLKHARRDDLLPADWVLELTARVADALDYAHRKGVVHRDIKPANIMYHAASDELKITDFGIARLTDTSRTKTGIILGTPSFMSPEQLAASKVTGQSDLYSLGVTMYQLLTGIAPFRADSIPKLMDKIMREKPQPVTSIRANLPPCVDSIINTALAKNPDDRYSSGRAMAMALRECAKNFGGAK